MWTAWTGGTGQSMGGVTSGIGLFLSAVLTGRLMDEARQEAPMIKMFTDDFVTCGENLYFGGKKNPPQS